MNREQPHGHLRQVVGALRENWGRVIDDRTMHIRGERDRLLGRMQAGGRLTQEAAGRKR